MLNKQHYPFSLPDLEYPYNSLEPIISEMTMKLHHDKLLKAYIDKLNDILKDYPEFHGWTLEKILSNLYTFPENIRINVRNNAGGVLNHIIYFNIINPNKVGKEPINITKAIINKYSNMNRFLTEFKIKSNQMFGSGYVFLVINKNNELDLISTPNQNSVYELNLYPLFLIDLWEHAYYLDYNNRRDEYINNFIKIINMEKLEERYLKYFDY